MLSEEQIDIFGEAFTEIFQKLENDIISDIARRVHKTDRYTETAELQARFLRDLGYSPRWIRIEVLRKLNADKAYATIVEQNTLEAKAAQMEAIEEAKRELKEVAPELYEAAGNMSFNADLSMWQEAGQKLPRGGAVDNLIKAMQKRGTDEALNLTKSLGFKTPTATVRVQNMYTSVLNDALTRSVSGTFSYSSAVDAAVRTMAQSGLRTIDFASGISRQIDTAARNAIVTALGQLAGDIMQANIEETGVPMVQVSQHWGARESHALWQGGVYTIEQFKSVCGYGEPSNPAHIYSYNCRHSHYPFWPGISEVEEFDPEPGPFEVEGKTYTYYQATQKQRAMERQIRALKREVNAGGDKAVLGSLIRQKTREYRAFSDAVNIRPKLERLRVVGYSNDVLAKTGNVAIASPRFLNRNDPLYRNAANIKPIKGYEDIVVHGDKLGFVFIDADGKESNVSASDFADILRSSNTYHGGAIRLISCETGSDDSIVAQALADELRVEVLAPTDIVYVYPNGDLRVGNNLTKKEGWIKIKPRDKR